MTLLLTSYISNVVHLFQVQQGKKSKQQKPSTFLQDLAKQNINQIFI